MCVILKLGLFKLVSVMHVLPSLFGKKRLEVDSRWPGFCSGRDVQEPKHSVTSVFAVITAAMVNENGRCAVALLGKPLTLNPKNPTSAPKP